ncbi:hypothetical protein HOK51_04240 [Candidatus Woesearchaeota archaeon]|jgi:hypothetical protein|nr:hypothetical protein [Candidatus Woesearchaeota archaeon]MBT6519032.1 hypothetical protein [Candidatus Woesearchaeota archaeon]MBT7368769.1 hypothetical protein [Candidatus Woesearchaeota archaeon]
MNEKLKSGLKTAGIVTLLGGLITTVAVTEIIKEIDKQEHEDKRIGDINLKFIPEDEKTITAIITEVQSENILYKKHYMNNPNEVKIRGSLPVKYVISKTDNGTQIFIYAKRGAIPKGLSTITYNELKDKKVLPTELVGTYVGTEFQALDNEPMPATGIITSLEYKL